MNALPCIACGRNLEGCSAPNQPLDGLAFSSQGHYGTTVFDPMDGSALEINVCDPCLKAAGLEGRVLRYSASSGLTERYPGTPAPASPNSLPDGKGEA